MNLITRIKLLLVYYNILKPKKDLDYSKYELTFIDDFNGFDLDEDKWMTHYYWGHNLMSNNEIQWYTKDSFVVKNSILNIILKKQKIRGWVLTGNKRKSKTFNLASGLIHTGESFKQKYGRFEIRCKLPNEPGYLPSFWLINPASYPPEIDVFDFNETNKTSFNSGYIFGDDNNSKLFYEVFKKIKPVKLHGWNTFTLDWEPKKITWYYNGYKVLEAKNVGIPQTPMYIAINLAANNDSNLNDVEGKRMMVDWVKVYKHKS
jgi:beta-glucanase (GH16 family)